MEKTNIFEGAKFGDKFVTRDGRIAVVVEPSHTLWIEGEEYEYSYDINRNGLHTFAKPDENGNLPTSNKDIVSRYQEPIDNERLNNIYQQIVLLREDYNKSGQMEREIALMQVLELVKKALEEEV